MEKRPPGKFLISDLLRSLLVPFWGGTVRVGRPTSKSSHCVRSQIKCSHKGVARLRYEALENLFFFYLATVFVQSLLCGVERYKY